MATETTNYKLKKPEYNEYVDIGVLNENFDALDEKLKEIEEAAAEDKIMSGVYIEKGSIPLDRLVEIPTAESIGAVEEAELPTKIQSILTGGEISMVKSVQRGVITMSPQKGTSKTATINSVNVNKSVVLYGGYSTTADSWNQPFIEIRLELTNSTTVTASVGKDVYTNNVIPYQVIEYY